MPTEALAWIYDGPFHAVFLASTLTLSVLSNGLLLFVIIQKTSATIGSYRYLLAVFAVCDVFTSVAHAAINAVVHMTSTGAIMFPRPGAIMLGGYSMDTFVCLLFIVPYYQTFLILAYHFQYRYRAAASFTDNWSFSRWTMAGLLTYVVYISGIITACGIGFAPDDEARVIVPTEIKEIYAIDLQNMNRGFMMIAVKRPHYESGEMTWHGRTLICLAVLFLFFGGTASGIILCIRRTITAIMHVKRSPDSKLSYNTKQMQLNLFNALLIQSAIPMLFSYLPLGMVLGFPIITGISLGSFGNVLYLITTIFPSIDAFFVLYFIRRFRYTVIRLFHLSMTSSPVTTLSLI